MYGKLLKSELYRASKQKNPYILLVVLLALILIACVVLLKFNILAPFDIDSDVYIEIAGEGASVEGIEEAVELGNKMGLSAAENDIPLFGEGVFYKADVNTIFSMVTKELDTLLLLAIFVGIFVGDVYSMGIDKNLVICNKRRGVLFAARATVIAIYALILHVFSFIFTVIATGFMGEKIWFNWNAHTVSYLFLSYFLIVVFGLIIYAFTTLTKSKAAGITIGVVLSTGVLTTVLSFLDRLVKYLFDLKPDFTLTKYLVTQNLMALNVDFKNPELVRLLVVGAVYAVISVVGIVLLNKKRDIV